MREIVLKAIPTFRILDYAKAIEFYIEGLGFVLDWEHRFGAEEPVYMQISRNGLILHLSENERFQTGVIVFVESKGGDKRNSGHRSAATLRRLLLPSSSLYP